MSGSFHYNLNLWGVSRYYRAPKKAIHNIEERLAQASDISTSYAQKEVQQQNLSSGFKNSGDVSAHSRREIINRVRLLALLAKPKEYRTKKGKTITFLIQMITLTFKKDVPEKEAKKMLNTWLTNMRKTYGMENYVWRAELTQKGRIHFHIITDADLTMDITHSTWRKILVSNGYAGYSQDNATDVRRFNNVFAYIAKYAGKKEKNKTERQQLFSRLWSSSQTLSTKKFKEATKELAEFVWYFLSKMNVGVSHVVNDWAECVFYPIEKLIKMPAFQHHAGKYLRQCLRYHTPFPSTCTWYDQKIEEFFKRTEAVQELTRSHGYGID